MRRAGLRGVGEAFPGAFLCAALAACGAATPPASDDAGPDASASACGPNLKAHGPACVPVLDDCPGNQVPIPGGGCKRIGVEPCELDGQRGLKGPPDWTCQRIGVDECEPPGGGYGLKGPPDWTCKPIGPPRACSSGWVTTGDGWCEPVLPQRDSCPPGTMEVLGKTECQPIGSCGSGIWDPASLDQTTVFVSKGAAAGKHDGTEQAPFTTIAAALEAVPDGGQVVVAAGTYFEDLLIDRPVRLRGRCAKLVTVKGSGGSAAITVAGKATGSELRGLTVSGPGNGIAVSEGAKVKMAEVAILQTESRGIEVSPRAELTLSDSLVADGRGAGIAITGARADLRGVVVRGIEPGGSDGKEAEGIMVSSGGGQAAELRLTESLVTGARLNGLWVRSARAIVERSMMRESGSLPDPYSAGILATLDGALGAQPSLELRDCVVSMNSFRGVWLLAAKAVVERTVIRDTRPFAGRGVSSNKGRGNGLRAQSSAGVASTVLIAESALVRNVAHGIYLAGSDGVVHRSVIADTREKQSASGAPSAGIWVDGPSTLSVQDSLIARSRGGGLFIDSGFTTIERTVVRDVLPRSDGYFGDGIHAGGTLLVRDVVITGTTNVGISLEAASAILERTVIERNEPLPGEDHVGSGLLAFSTKEGKRSRAKVSMTDCLVDASFGNGIVLASSDARLERIVVQRTTPSVPCSGVGLAAFSEMMIGVVGGSRVLLSLGPTRLTLLDSLISQSSTAGVGLWGSSGLLERSVIRDTRGQACDDHTLKGTALGFGEGLVAVGDGELSISDTLIGGSVGMGIELAGRSARIARTVVRDTSAGDAGLYGVGIVAHAQTQPISITLEDTRVVGSSAHAVLAESALVTARRCVIQGTGPGRIDPGEVPGRGDAVWSIRPQGSAFEGRFEVSDSLVEGSSRSGVWFDGSKGALRRSVLRKGMFSVMLDNGATPEIGSDNVFDENTENRLTFGPGLQSAPSIPVMPPPPI